MIKAWTIAIGLGALVAGLIVYEGMPLRVEAATPSSSKLEKPQATHEDPHIVPHKALYKIEMVSKSSSAQILNISGEMFF